jgi:hypothetical protein
MTRLREVVLAGALLSLLPGAVRAEAQPTSVSTATITLDITPPDPFSPFSADRMAVLPDGTRFVLGSGVSNTGAFQFLLKVNPNGTQAWAAPVASLFTSDVKGLAADASGNAYVAYTDFSDFSQPHARVVKYNAAGGVAANADLTPNTPGGDCCPFSAGVAVDSARGRVYAAFTFFSSAQSQNTFAVAALDINLLPVATRVYDPGFTGSVIGSDPMGGIFTDSLGDVWVVAWQLPTGAANMQMLAVHYIPDLAGVNSIAQDGGTGEDLFATVDPRGGVVISGDQNNQFQFILHRVTNGGFGPPFRFDGFDSIASPMAVDPTGNLYILGFNPNTFSPAVTKVNTSNALAWDQPGPYLDLPGTFSPGAVAATSSTTFDVAGISFDASPNPVVLLHYQSVASSTAAFALSIATGNAQLGTITKAARIPLTVKVADALGMGVAGATVIFSTSAAPSGAAGHGLSVVSAATAQDGTASTILTFGDHVGTYTVTAACAGCVPPSAIFTAVAELRLVISLSTDSIRPLGTDTSPDQPRTTLLVTAAGVSVPNDRVANYPVILVSTPVAFSGGHEHEADRPTGSFEVPENQSVYTTDTGLDGSFLVSYVSTATSGQELITANSAVDAQVRTTTRTLTVEVPGLVPTPASPSPQKYFLSGSTSSHPVNHFGSTTTVAGSTSAAAQYFSSTQAAIGINDMSLVAGGILDVFLKWVRPHRLHRVGRSVDVDRCATKAGVSVLVDQKLLDKLMQDQGGLRIVEPPPDDNPIPACANKRINRMHYEFKQ